MFTPLPVSLQPASFPKQGFYSHAANDADDHAASLTGWRRVYDQLAPGRFTGSIQELWIDGLQIFHESTSHALRQSCVVDSESWWFVVPILASQQCNLGSSPIGKDMIAIGPGRSKFELLTPNDFQFLGLVVPNRDIEHHICALNQLSALPQAMRNHLIKIEPGQRLRLQELVRQILQEASGAPGVVANSSVRKSIRVDILDALSDICSTHEATGCTPDRQKNYYKIVRDVRRYLLDNHDDAISIADLCQTFKISRRTLQYAFQHVIGMNPNAYLRALRLNGVRRSLGNPNSNAVSVQQAAANWGFWHLSQFAHDYHSLFGELPSERLKRRSMLIS